ncbi:MAG: LacI family DNA-binding transcriptional regulator [Lachnospiraceae bacterium]|nr:LacI family DNA-binding transcriptional regulator [Lachnospiraceae bacterium]
MEEKRVRLADVAEALGLSTATVSKVIHGKTKKISDETVKRVQEKLEEMNYIPNMAGILLAQNNSKIIGVVIHDNPKYEGRVLEDGFIMASLNALSKQVNELGYFLMIKTTKRCEEIPVFASMWNMEGLILIGFCEAEYKKLRENMRISFVVYDGYFRETDRIVNLVIDHYDGGYQAGKYLKDTGHTRALCISDNCICMDEERMEGFRAAFSPGEVRFLQVPILKEERMEYYQAHLEEIKEYSAAFAVSDVYALEFIHFLQRQGVQVPEDISVIGFDDNIASRENSPSLTTIHQDADERASRAMTVLRKMKAGESVENRITLPVHLVVRRSTKNNETIY